MFTFRKIKVSLQKESMLEVQSSLFPCKKFWIRLFFEQGRPVFNILRGFLQTYIKTNKQGFIILLDTRKSLLQRDYDQVLHLLTGIHESPFLTFVYSIKEKSSFPWRVRTHRRQVQVDQFLSDSSITLSTSSRLNVLSDVYKETSALPKSPVTRRINFQRSCGILPPLPLPLPTEGGQTRD